MGKEERVNVRVEPDLRKDFNDVLELTGMGETQFVKAAIKALVEYVRENGEITLPLAIVPKSERKKSNPGKSDPAPPANDPDSLSTVTPRFHPSASEGHAEYKTRKK